MLLAPMYHRASLGSHGNPAGMLDAHFRVIAGRCHCVLPGEPTVAGRLNVCLTFDDGYFDFYAVVYPLLRKHGLRAVLAVPVSFIRERNEATDLERLWACMQRGPDGDYPEGYCTWDELRRMAESGTVRMAAHGFTHKRVDLPETDLHTEIAVPQTLLAARTGQPVDSFVLPYGRFSAAALRYAKQHYRYVFRIGNADNEGWNGNVLYRISADEMSSPGALFSSHRLAAYRLRRHWNRMRSR